MVKSFRRLVSCAVVFITVYLFCSTVMVCFSSGWLRPRVKPLLSDRDRVVRSLLPTVFSTAIISTPPSTSHGVTASNNSQEIETIGLQPLSLTTAQPGHRHSFANTKQEKGESCWRENCLNYLSIQERIAVSKCRSRTQKHLDGEIQRSDCHFLSSPSRAAVALVSAEGSGNTWLRGLLEKATGVCTGFCCCDHNMRARGFVGENVKSGKVLVVKTHFVIAQWVGSAKKVGRDGSYGSAVVLVRHPALALVADWNRRITNQLMSKREANRNTDPHTNTVSEDHFRTQKWGSFHDDYLNKWKERLLNWVLSDHKHPVHVVNYEDLKRDTVGEVEKILDFLQFPYSHDELAERLREDYTVFQRPHTNDTFEHFYPEQKEKLRTTLLTVMAAAKDSGKADLFHFDEYLESLPDIK